MATNNMHILIVAQQWEPEQGVPPKRGRWMVDQLIQHGHRVTVVAPPPHYPGGKLLSSKPENQAWAVSSAPGGETIYRANFRPHSARIFSRVIDQAVVGATSIVVALRASRASKPDILLATAPPLPAAFTGYAVAKLLRLPFVIDLRDAWPELVDFVVTADPDPSAFKTAVKRLAHPAFLMAGRIFGFVLGRADGIITTSAWHGRSIQARRKVPTCTIANDILLDLSKFPSASQDRKAPELRVLYAGNVGRAQGLENAIMAARAATEAGTKIVLRFIGGGAHLPRLKEFAADLPYVEFFEQESREALQAHHEWTDTILVHLKDWEPLTTTVPSKLFDAIASGKHVTLAANGESVELLEQSGVGDAVPAMDPYALAQLWIALAQSPDRLNVGSRGHEWLQQRVADLQPGTTFVDFLESAKKRVR